MRRQKLTLGVGVAAQPSLGNGAHSVNPGSLEKTS
jgi:hypothetical protein